MKDYFKYRFSTDFEFNLSEKDFTTIIGNNNELIIFTLLNGHKKCNIFVGDLELNSITKYDVYKKMSMVIYRYLNIFVAETVIDEIAFGLESLAMSRDDIINLIVSESRLFKIEDILERDPNSLGISDKVKVKILSALIVKPKILILDNVMCELDYNDKLLLFNILNEFTKNGGIVINLTSDVEETIYGNKIIVINDKKILCEDKTMKVLNEEKLLKRIGVGLPFMIELSKYLMDYEIIDKYFLEPDKLVGGIWK